MSARDRINKKLTQRFIDDNPVTITLRRPTYVKTASGGRQAGATTTLDPQTFTKIAPAFRSGGATGFTSEDGSVVAFDFALVGMVDADIKIGDTFEIDDEPYTVQYVDVSREDWAKRAAITRRKA